MVDVVNEIYNFIQEIAIMITNSASADIKAKRFTPSEAVHEFCRQCVCGNSQFNSKEVLNCFGNKAYTGSCVFYPYRMGKRRVSVKTIRKFCLQCCNGDRLYVSECPAPTCPCHPYRFGGNPARKKTGSTDISKIGEKNGRETGKNSLE